MPTLEPIASGTKKLGGIWIISTGGKGMHGAPVEDSAPCQKSLVKEEIASKKDNFLALFDRQLFLKIQNVLKNDSSAPG